MGERTDHRVPRRIPNKPESALADSEPVITGKIEGPSRVKNVACTLLLGASAATGGLGLQENPRDEDLRPNDAKAQTIKGTSFDGPVLGDTDFTFRDWRTEASREGVERQQAQRVIPVRTIELTDEIAEVVNEAMVAENRGVSLQEWDELINKIGMSAEWSSDKVVSQASRIEKQLGLISQGGAENLDYNCENEGCLDETQVQIGIQSNSTVVARLERTTLSLGEQNRSFLSVVYRIGEGDQKDSVVIPRVEGVPSVLPDSDGEAWSEIWVVIPYETEEGDVFGVYTWFYQKEEGDEALVSGVVAVESGETGGVEYVSVSTSELMGVGFDKLRIPSPEIGESSSALSTLTLVSAGEGREVGILNDEEITDPNILAREYDPEVGGYVVERGSNVAVYREAINGDAVVVDSIETSFGNILLEMPVMWQGIPQQNQTQVRWTEKARANMEQGMREFYLVAYQQAYGRNRQEAEEMLEQDYPIPITWVKDSLSWVRAGELTKTNSWTRYYTPSKGVSFLILDEPYPYTEEYLKQYPRLVISFMHSRSEPAYLYGFEVTREGMLVSINYRSGEDCIAKTNQLNFGLIDALRATGTDRGFVRDPVYHTDYRQVPDYSRDVMYQLGMGRYREEDYVGITDFESFSLIRASRQ